MKGVDHPLQLGLDMRIELGITQVCPTAVELPVEDLLMADQDGHQVRPF